MARRQILDGRCAVVDRPASPFRAALPPTLFADNLPVAHQPVENDVDSKLSVGGSNRDGAPFLARMRPIERHRPVRAPIDPYRKPRSKALTRVSFSRIQTEIAQRAAFRGARLQNFLRPATSASRRWTSGTLPHRQIAPQLAKSETDASFQALPRGCPKSRRKHVGGTPRLSYNR